jgi:hypothetical protein
MYLAGRGPRSARQHKRINIWKTVGTVRPAKLWFSSSLHTPAHSRHSRVSGTTLLARISHQDRGAGAGFVFVSAALKRKA